MTPGKPIFLLFVGYTYHPGGGINDAIPTLFSSSGEAWEALIASDLECQWAHCAQIGREGIVVAWVAHNTEWRAGEWTRVSISRSCTECLPALVPLSDKPTP